MFKMPTTLTFERQKMTVEIWEKLKSHIMKQREKRKQEQEQDAEQERHRREQEIKRKLDATTLEDIKEQLGKLENDLSDLHKQKHELFLELKKVLHEDDARKRQTENELLAAKAAQNQAQNPLNQQYQFFATPSTMQSNVANSSRLSLSTNQSPTPQQLNLNNSISNAIHQQLSKHSPITTITNLQPTQQQSIQSNHLASHSNTVITQPPSAHQQTQMPANKTSLKRPLERSSPQQFNNVLPNPNFSKAQQTFSTAYTPSVSRISTSNQAFFPTQQPNRHLLPGNQINFDNVLNSGQLNQQQISQLQLAQQQELYHQHLMKNLNMSSLQAPIIPIQNPALKSGNITGIQSGLPPNLPMQRLPNSSTPNSSNNSNKFTNRYMY